MGDNNLDNPVVQKVVADWWYEDKDISGSLDFIDRDMFEMFILTMLDTVEEHELPNITRLGEAGVELIEAEGGSYYVFDVHGERVEVEKNPTADMGLEVESRSLSE